MKLFHFWLEFCSPETTSCTFKWHCQWLNRRIRLSLRIYADQPATAEEKYNMSNAAINKFPLLSRLFTQNRGGRSSSSNYAAVCTKDRDLFLVYHNIWNQLLNKLITQTAQHWFSYGDSGVRDSQWSRSKWHDEAIIQNKKTQFINTTHKSGV